MVSLNPCRRCHRRGDCQKRTATLATLKGTGITKANLKCSIPAEDFPVGAAVTVKAFELVESGSWEPTYDQVECVRQGVVSNWRSGKATVALDDGQEITQPHKLPIYFLHAEPDRLTRIGGDLVAMCQCGRLPAARCDAGQFPKREAGAEWWCERTEAERPAKEFA